jgi:hypothetical protein
MAMHIKETLNKSFDGLPSTGFLRQAQDERQVVDFVRGEPFGVTQDRPFDIAQDRLVEPHSKPTCSAFP